MRRLVFILFFFTTLCLLGCGNGFDCPPTVPSCCYDTVFGCEIFDLPPTCSCSSYGIFRPIVGTPLERFSRPQTLGNLSGTWSGILEQKSSSCAFPLKQVNGVISIHDTKKNLTVRVLHYGSLHGIKRGNRFTANGSYKPPALPCLAHVNVSFQTVSGGTGRVLAGISYRCGTAPRCTSTYQGVVQQQ